MKSRLTIKQMVKALVFAATMGRRTAENYAAGMLVIDSLHRFYYRQYFLNAYARFLEGGDPREELRAIYRGLRERTPFEPRCAAVADALYTLLTA